jgi:hypothetical protein
MIHVELTPPSGPMEILVRAPFWVDYLGVYETRDLMNPFPWTPLGTVPHTFDPMAWSYPLPGDLRYVILANHVRDSDGDGVLDALEKLVLGTDPDKWDTDGDGVGDYDEVFIHKSSPLAGSGTVGGPPDQVKYGLGLPDQDMSKVISGSAALRYQMRRVIRDKHGFTGFVDGATKFLGYQSDYKFGQCGVNGYAQHVHYEGSYNLDYALPSLKYKVICPVAREGSGWDVPLSEVGIPNAAPMYMPDLGSPVLAGETRENTSGSVGGGGGMTSNGSLSRSYGDSELLARASADYGSIQTNPLDWNHWLLLTRPLAGEPGGATPPNQEPTLALLDPVVGLTPPASRKHVHFDGPESPLMRAELQGIGVAAAVEPEVIPPGYLLRTIHLEIARKPPTEAFPAGEISRVSPREVYLKPGTPLAVSMEFKIPPPAEEGTVEVVDGYVGLSMSGLSERHEVNPGASLAVGAIASVTVTGLDAKVGLAAYRLRVTGPSGALLPVTPSGGGPVQTTPLALSAPSGGGEAQTYTFPLTQEGVFQVVVQVAGDALAAESDWLECDRIDIRAVQLDLAVDGNRDDVISFSDPADKSYLFWVNDDHDARYLLEEINEPDIVAEDDLEPVSGLINVTLEGVTIPPNCFDDTIGAYVNYEWSSPDPLTQYKHWSLQNPSNSKRDLEDFARMHMRVSAMMASDSTVTFSMKFDQVTENFPEINLFEAVDPSGDYLSVNSAANLQVAKTRIATISAGQEAEIPRSLIRPNGEISPFLFEGRGGW